MVRAVLFVAAAPVVLRGCETERIIAKSVRHQVGARVSSVACPSGLTARKGATFECTVTGVDGTTGKATVTQQDDQGNVKVNAPFIHVRALEEQIAGGLGDQVGASDVTVSCPEIIEGAKGGVFECEATSGSDEAIIEVTQTDGRGNVRYKVKR